MPQESHTLVRYGIAHLVFTVSTTTTAQVAHIRWIRHQSGDMDLSTVQYALKNSFTYPRFTVSPSSRGSSDAYLFWPKLVLRVPLAKQILEVDAWQLFEDEILGSGVTTPEGKN